MWESLVDTFNRTTARNSGYSLARLNETQLHITRADHAELYRIIGGSPMLDIRHSRATIRALVCQHIAARNLPAESQFLATQRVLSSLPATYTITEPGIQLSYRCRDSNHAVFLPLDNQKPVLMISDELSLTALKPEPDTHQLTTPQAVEADHSLQALQQKLRVATSAQRGYQFSLPNAELLIIDPRQSDSAGFTTRSLSATQTRSGGYALTFAMDDTFSTFGSESLTINDLIKTLHPTNSDVQQALLKEFTNNSYDPNNPRSVLSYRTRNGEIGYIIFSNDRSRLGIALLCSQGEAQFLDFAGQPNRPQITLRKPVIYIYPTERTCLDVAVELPSQATFSALYPPCKIPGRWQVEASPDGSLRMLDSDRTYPYLYWEATQYSFPAVQVEHAFCIPAGDTISFLEAALPQYGLNDRETTDFITYWLPHLQEAPYNIIQFLTDSYAQQYPLTLSVQPDTLIRLFMVYQPSDVAIECSGTLPDSPQMRRGFSVVEWGGARVSVPIESVR